MNRDTMHNLTRAATLAFALGAVLAGHAGDAGRAGKAPTDPTEPTAALADRLRRSLPDAAGMKVHALVVGASEEGAALIGKTAKDALLVRRGSSLSETVEGVRVKARVRSVSPAGVELETAEGASRLFLAGSYTPLAAPTNEPPEFVRHLECRDVAIDTLLRLVADQTGVNISATDATSKKTASLFLRNVPAEAAVEEVCRTTGLWFRRDPEGGVIRVSTMAEYAENLRSFREETTRTFTLLYPNVIEVASVIYGLHPDRTLLSLGEEEFLEEDEYDLSRRFRRFRVIEENGNSQFMDMQAPRSTSSGGRNAGNVFSFSRGSALSNLTQWDRLRQRQRIGGETLTGEGTRKASLSTRAAKELETSARQGNTNAYEQAYQQNAVAAANIFVSVSRKNNLLVVRTSDVKVMDEITRLVKELDVPTPMVLMEMRILELQLEDDFNASFKWDFDGRAASTSWAETLGTGAMAAFEPTFAFTLFSKHIAAQINLLARDGKVKTLATPTLLVANNEVSRIFSGNEYPIVSGWSAGSTVYTEGTIDRIASVPEIEKKDVGTMLLISPNINADKTVTLRLLQENSEIAGKADVEVYSTSDETDSEVAGKRQIDYVASRSLTGTFVAKDGMTVMAGGLITEKDEEQYYRTPLLGSIPLVGFLFRGTEKVKKRTELIILIKPHVIMTPYEGGKISQKLMRELSDHPAADGRGNMGVFREGKKPAAKDHSALDDLKMLIQSH